MTEIIGHGTWYDKMGIEIIKREQGLQRELRILRTESGIGASGIPHIGSLADATRSHAISLAIKNQGFPSELIAFSDDKDGLRKVPAGFPSQLTKYIGFPVSSIPDPFGNCHPSFGEHVTALLLSALDECGIEYRFLSGNNIYRQGLLNHQIELLLKNAKKVGQIVKEEVGQEKFMHALPYYPICQNCGRIYTTQAFEFIPKENMIRYVCKGMEIGAQWLTGCGHRSEVDYRRAEGKLSWIAGEFAARWAALGISFEAYGKDIADSVRVNDRICKEILNFEPPLHVQYEVFLDKSGKKISKSKGNVFTPQLWFRYGSPQSLLLLTLKRFTGTRTLSVADIPSYMNELDELEDVFFGKKKIHDPKDQAKLAGLYMYCWGLNPPKKPGVHVPYTLLVHLAKVAPKGLEVEFIKQKLLSYRYKADAADIAKRISYALQWVEDIEEEPEEDEIKLIGAEALAVQELITILEREDNAEQLQGAIFETARKHHVEPKRFFSILYHALLGVPRGPRIGPYILDVGRERVSNKLKKIIE